MRYVTAILATVVFVAVLVFDAGAVVRYAFVAVTSHAGFAKLAAAGAILVACVWVGLRVIRRRKPVPRAARRRRTTRKASARRARGTGSNRAKPGVPRRGGGKW